LKSKKSYYPMVLLSICNSVKVVVKSALQAKDLSIKRRMPNKQWMMGKKFMTLKDACSK